MKLLNCITILILLGSVAVGQRVLDANEVAELLEELTQSPRFFWLPAGTIRTRHLEYRADEDRLAETEELFRFDGNRFYWDIVLLDELTESPDATTERMAMLNRRASQHRIFSYDGAAYTRYYKSADYAVVVLDQQEGPMQLFGPFTAGIIPWGVGSFTLDKLAGGTPAATEFFEDDQPRIRLSVTASSNPAQQMTFVLDPGKDYAVCAYDFESDNASIQQRYSDYRQIGQRWVPFIITAERTDLRGQEPMLMSYDDWRFESVDPQTPTAPFAATFQDGTAVELQPYGTMKSYLYHAAGDVNISQLLQDKITVEYAPGDQKPNCAELAVQHVARRFSKQINTTQAAQNNAEADLTSLYAIRTALEAAGLHCVAIKTDIETLAAFRDYGVILHYPTAQHYVVLDRIAEDKAWTVDLTSRKFFWKRPVRDLLLDWSEGVALLVSDSPILLSGQVQFLDTTQQQQIVGGTAAGYSCTELIQFTEHVLCSMPIGDLCGGCYYKFWERWGCQENPNGGTCVGEEKVGYDYTHCINNPYQHSGCTITGNWYPRYIRACL